MHIELLVEEESCAEAMSRLVPKIVGPRASFLARTFQGKPDLLQQLPARLRGYAKWLPPDYRIAVLVDCDNDVCKQLKANLENIAAESGLLTRSRRDKQGKFQLLARIAIEELESWFFGDLEALRRAYPKVPATLSQRRGFRDPDAIAGGTWEKLERVLKDAGYYPAGIPKIEVARNVSLHMEPERNESRSFRAFREGLKDLTM